MFECKSHPNIINKLLNPEMGGFTLKQFEPNLLSFQRSRYLKKYNGASNYASACWSDRRDHDSSWLNTDRSFIESTTENSSFYLPDTLPNSRVKGARTEQSKFKRPRNASLSNQNSPKNRSVRFSLKEKQTKKIIKFVSSECLPERRSPTRYGNYLVRLFDGNLYETREDQARSVLNSYKQSIKKNQQEVAKKYKKVPIRSIISSINPRRNTETRGFNGAQFRFQKYACQTPPSHDSSTQSDFSDSDADIVSTSSESKKVPQSWNRSIGRSTFASKRAFEFKDPSNRFRQTFVKDFDDLDFLQNSESGVGEEIAEHSDCDKFKEFEEIQDSFFESEQASEKITTENIIKPDFVLPSSFKMMRRLQRSRSVISQNVFDVEELSESQIESKEELAKAALMRIIDRSYFRSEILANHDEEDKEALYKIKQRQEAQRREVRAQLISQLEKIAPCKEDFSPQECANMTHKLIQLGKSYKLQMGRILLNMMADRGNICIHTLKRKILSGVDLNNREVIGQIKRKSRRKSMAIPRPSLRVGEIPKQILTLRSKRTVRLYRGPSEKRN